MTPESQSPVDNSPPDDPQWPYPQDSQSMPLSQPYAPAQSYAYPTEPMEVWPPPVYGQARPQIFYPFTFLYERVAGSVSDIRSGKLAIDTGGIIVDGKSLPRAEIYQTILIITLFLRGLVLIAYLIMRYACLKAEILAVPWNMVQSVTLAPKRRKLCVVYQAPNYKGVVKTFSLTMQFKRADFDAIAGTLEAYAPGLARTGNIRAASSPVVTVWATLTILVLIAFLLFAVTGYH